MLEKDLKMLMMDWLNLQPDTQIWRQNTGASSYVFRGKRRLVRFGVRGQSDLVGLTAGGRFLAVEVKRKRGKLTIDQSEYLNTVRRYGGIGLCVRSLEELKDQLKAEIELTSPNERNK